MYNLFTFIALYIITYIYIYTRNNIVINYLMHALNIYVYVQTCNTCNSNHRIASYKPEDAYLDISKIFLYATDIIIVI